MLSVHQSSYAHAPRRRMLAGTHCTSSNATRMAVDVVTSNSMSHQTQAVTHLHRDINRRIVDATCVMRVLDIVEEGSQDFNAVNISTAFHRLARMWRDLPDLTSSSTNGQARLDHALQTLMQLAVSHIKEVLPFPACLLYLQSFFTRHH